MTSMPFTSSMGVSALLRAVPRRDLLLRGIGLRRGLDHRTQELGVGVDPIRRVAPALAIPRVDAAAVQALVIAAGGLERLDHVSESEPLDLRGIETEVLRAPANFLARDD